MLPPLQGQLNDWKYARGNTIAFLKTLTMAELQQKLPRKTYTTIWEQIIEMAWVQHGFTQAIITKTLDNINWEAPDFSTKTALLEKMAALDTELETILASCTGTEVVDWFGVEKSIYEHVSSLQSHEMMHLGQIMAFCQTLGIGLPPAVIKSMHITGAEYYAYDCHE